MEQVKIEISKSRIKILKSLLQVEYENKYNLEDFIVEVLEVGIDTLIDNLSDEGANSVIKLIAEQE